MPSNRTEYAGVLAEWDERNLHSHISVPAEQGSVAILSAYVDGLELDGSERADVDKQPAFDWEALQLADMYQERGVKAVVALDAKPADFREALQDPTVSSIVVIGHGCLTSMQVPYPENDDRLDWQDLVDMSDHLKTGTFTQRVCGTLPRQLNVPLGLMVVNDHRNVHAPVGEQISPASLSDPQNELIIPVTSSPRLEYDDIKREFPQRKRTVMERAHVALGAVRHSLTV